MDEILVSDNLKLRLVDVGFASEAFAVVEKNRKCLEKWLPWVSQTTSVNDELEYFEGSLQRNREGKCMEMGIFSAADASGHDGTPEWNFIGMCGLVHIERSAENEHLPFAEIGYWLSQEHQGKGIITTCCKKLIETAFTKLALGKIKIMAHKDNSASVSVAKRLGFLLTDEKLLRPHPIFHVDIGNVIIFAMTKEEWRKRAP